MSYEPKKQVNEVKEYNKFGRKEQQEAGKINNKKNMKWTAIGSIAFGNAFQKKNQPDCDKQGEINGMLI